MDKKTYISRVVNDFASLLSNDPLEEEVHNFLLHHNDILEGCRSRWLARNGIIGTLSKFPITQDRVPDFTLVNIGIEFTQTPNEIALVEIKRPSVSLFVGDRRMSKELNDAWIECLDSIRLIGPVYQDYIRRIVKRLSSEHSFVYDGIQSGDLRQDESNWVDHIPYRENNLPRLKNVIIIGRRESLGMDDIRRLHEISASTRFSIRVLTYDAILDYLRHQMTLV